MVVLPGAPAFTNARLQKLEAHARAANPGISGVVAHHVHVLEYGDNASAEDRERLEAILGFDATCKIPSGTFVFVVTPRLGTISPWSSKATDILARCGLGHLGRIERGIVYAADGTLTNEGALVGALHDRMTESVLGSTDELAKLFAREAPRKLTRVELLARGRVAIEEANAGWGLALSDDEVDYLSKSFTDAQRDPTDVELMMFAQANSEHCRHKIFNATFIVDGVEQAGSLFGRIKKSTEASPEGVLSAYSDNAAVIAGSVGGRFFPREGGVYASTTEPIHILAKVETHNHPTAISPFPGAATGAGGEIRDEGATGRGSKPKAGLAGFAVSHLRLPDAARPWEVENPGKPGRIVDPLRIMIDGPLGAAAFNNEFGRPNIGGYFRDFELRVPTASGPAWRGFHKPILIAGGLGNIREVHVAKGTILPGNLVIVLGGPAMLIGLGGGAASSVASGASSENLDFASVQRDNAEMERRCQEVIDRCWQLGDANPIRSVHDVGAGGLSNALPELVHESKRGARFDLRAVPSAEPGLAPHELWCNEAQERYVLAIDETDLARFEALCTRERCPFAVVGRATEERDLHVADATLGEDPVVMPMQVLLGKPPRMTRNVTRVARPGDDFTGKSVDGREALRRVLLQPTVADKSFLLTIGDRSVTGLVARDPFVGPWQIACADVAVTQTAHDVNAGEAMAMGERPPIAVLNPAASARIAIAEALTNVCATNVGAIGRVKLSANWMAACGEPGEDAALFDAVQAVGAELAPALGIAIPVGKDSLSMRTVWSENDEKKSVVSPLSLVVTAFAAVGDVRLTLTPELDLRGGDADLVLIDLSAGKDRLGGSIVAQVFERIGGETPDLDDPKRLLAFWELVQSGIEQGWFGAYHDRSDGGLAALLCEVAFASGAALDVNLPAGPTNDIAAFFNEELGAVLQVYPQHAGAFAEAVKRLDLVSCTHRIGTAKPGRIVKLARAGRVVVEADRYELRALWSDTSHRIASLRDDASCANEEHALRTDPSNQGLTAEVAFDATRDLSAPYLNLGAKPRVAIFREQGVNGHVEMAACFDRVGFEAVDVHASDILDGRVALESFRGLVACGGFSYGDVLGAGQGWAKSILFQARARAEFQAFFERGNTFSLGVCNGCQMLANLRELIPGAHHWAKFRRNRSEQFEARVAMVRVEESPSIFFRGMVGSRLPVAVAHGEGRAVFDSEVAESAVLTQRLVAARFADGNGKATNKYPMNPNGSRDGLTSLTTPDGRATILMPHPERVIRTAQLSWHPREWGHDSPWLRFFANARAWVN